MRGRKTREVSGLFFFFFASVVQVGWSKKKQQLSADEAFTRNKQKLVWEKQLNWKMRILTAAE